jgi:hypothetical protein
MFRASNSKQFFQGGKALCSTTKVHVLQISRQIEVFSMVKGIYKLAMT